MTTQIKSGMPVVEVKHLSVEYVGAFHRTPAVRDLSFTIHTGEVFGLVGESGCGKTTAAMACVRYLPKGTVLTGELNFLGQNILKLGDNDLRRLRGDRVAMVYQDPLAALNPSLNVESQMAEIITTHEHTSARAAHALCRETLERVRIADPDRVLRSFPHQLSGGMQQRVLIAMSLLLKPALLIMDEPTTGLDVTIEAAVLDLVNDLRRDYDTAILFISHNLGVVARLCQRVGVMYAGQMVEEADVETLFRNPRHPYTLALLRCIPSKGADKRTRTLWSIAGRVPPTTALPPGCIFAPRCPLAQPQCSETRPDCVQIADGHTTRCMLHDRVDVAAFDAYLATQTATQSAECAERQQQQDAVLGIKDLRVYFQSSGGFFSFRRKPPVKAVDGVSFTIPECGTLGIAGESGCGKSTVARTVAGLNAATGGTMAFAGQDLKKLVQKRPRTVLSQLQMVFQNPDSTLNPQKTVEQELTRPLRLLGVVERGKESEAISQLLASVNLDDSYRDRYPRELSGGEKQRVAIARAFAGRPRLVLCDEPISSLDVSVQSTILNLLLQLQRENDVSMMFISHDLSVVRYLSDTVAIMYLGGVCEIGPAEEVFAVPHHPYTEALLSAIPVPDPTVKQTRIRLEGSVPSPTNPPSGCRFHTRCPRKIGAICEQNTPPAQVRGSHTIHCHLSWEELTRLQAETS